MEEKGIPFLITFGFVMLFVTLIIILLLAIISVFFA
jgi:hypothetical protein